MIRVLIVDDEEIIRRGIRYKLGKLNRSIEVVGEASDGEEALIKAEELRPDVIITDIKMPKLDGLLFIERTSRLLPETQFIIVSGYQDFSYAQKALKLGVCDYLLKPIDNDEFRTLLERLVEKLQIRENSSEYINALKKQAEDPDTQFKNHTLADMVYNGAHSAQDAERYGLKYDSDLTICIVNVISMGDMFSAANDKLAPLACANIFEKVVSQRTGCIVYQETENINRFVGIMHGASERELLIDLVQLAISSIQAEINVNVWAALGEQVLGVGHVSDAFKTARLSAEQKAVFAKRQLITYEDYLAIKNYSYELSECEKKHLETLLKQGDYTSAKDDISGIFHKMAESKIVRSKIETISRELLLLLINTLKAMDFYNNFDLTNKKLDQDFSDCITLDDFKTLLLKRAIRVCELIKKSKAEAGGNIIKKIVAHIESRYYSSIKLNEIADEYFINPCYLSQLFLQETSKNFKQFLSEVRINNARELLESTSLPISQIAELVGYNDRSYFSNTFTKYVGLTPAHYRTANSGDEHEE